MPRIVDIVGTIAQNFNIGDATVLVDSNTKSLESSIGYGLKNSKYVSNVILSCKEPVTYSNLTITLPADYEFLISNGRDLYNETTNPTGTGGLKSTYVKTSTPITMTMTALDEGVSKRYDIFYNYTDSCLSAYETSKISYGSIQPSNDLYDLWRYTNLNKYYINNNSSWTEKQLIKICTFLLTGNMIRYFDVTRACDLLRFDEVLSLTDNIEWKRQSIAASSTATSSITLNEPCKNINNMIVLVEHMEMPISAYSLNSTGTVLSFGESVPSGLRIDLRWL